MGDSRWSVAELREGRPGVPGKEASRVSRTPSLELVRGAWRQDCGYHPGIDRGRAEETAPEGSQPGLRRGGGWETQGARQRGGSQVSEEFPGEGGPGQSVPAAAGRICDCWIWPLGSRPSRGS